MFTRNDVAYTILNRLELSLRGYISNSLFEVHGPMWWKITPQGVQDKAIKRATEAGEDAESGDQLIQFADLYDLCEIMGCKQTWPVFRGVFGTDLQALQTHMKDMTLIRNKVMHNRPVHAIELSKLRVLSFELASKYELGKDVLTLLDRLEKDPQHAVIPVPPDFLIEGQPRELENIPDPDFEQLFGRESEIEDVRKLLTGRIHRVVTISGSGGIGKSSLAIEVARRLWSSDQKPFKGIIWVSAKQQELSATGVEQIGTQGLRDFDDLLNTILRVLGQGDLVELTTEEKRDSVNILAETEPVLLVVDNLETIADQRIMEFIKEFSPPSKVLITSRLGLGEVEKRYPLQELQPHHAKTLARAVARESRVPVIANMEDGALTEFVKAGDCVPLAIKYMVGQVGLGTCVESVLKDIANPRGELVQFCFNNVFLRLSEAAQQTLCAFPTFHEVPSQTSLDFVVEIPHPQFDEAIRELTVAALIYPEATRDGDGSLLTHYKVPSMTMGYAQDQLDSHPAWKRRFQTRQNELVQLKDTVRAANEQYRHALTNMGATTEREMIAAFRAQAAFQAYQDGDYAKAVKGFEEAVEIADRLPSIYKLWAFVEDKERHDVQVDKLMNKATQLDRENPSLWTMWGNMLRPRDPRKAKACLLTALKIDDQDTRTLHSLAVIEQTLGNYAESARYLEQIPLEGQPRREECYVRDALAQTFQRWGRKCLRDGDITGAGKKLDRAYDECQRGFRRDHNNPQLRNTSRRIQLTRGEWALASGQPELALSALREAIIPNPKLGKERDHNAEALYQQTLAHKKLGNISEAKAACHKAISLSYYPDMRNRLTKLLSDLNGAS